LKIHIKKAPAFANDFQRRFRCWYESPRLSISQG
jgi:hypothetical protein